MGTGTKEHDISLVRCPYCNEPMHRISSVIEFDPDIEAPRPGDWTVCILCAQISRFNDVMQLRKTRWGDIKDLGPEVFAKLAAIQQSVRQVSAVFKVKVKN